MSEAGDGATHLDEDDTEDSFMKQIIREDNKQAQGHVRAQSEAVARPQAFSKARTRPRNGALGLTIDNLVRHNKNNPAPPEVRSKSSLGSVSSGKTDPPLNVPQDWGRRAKKNPQWIRRIQTDHPGLYPEHGVNGGKDWAEAAAEVPLPGVTSDDSTLPSVASDDSPLSRRGSSRSTPAMLSRKPLSPAEDDDELRFSEDFDEADILASTPAPRKIDKMDDVLRREMNALGESGLPTPPRDRSRSRSRPRTPNATEKGTESAVATKQPLSYIRSPTHSRIPGPNERNGTRPKPSTNGNANKGPLALFSASPRSARRVGILNRSMSSDTPKPLQRAPHFRDESRDILRRLSRTPSTAPSPAQSRPQTAPSAASLERALKPADETQSRPSLDSDVVTPNGSGGSERTAHKKPQASKVDRPVVSHDYAQTNERSQNEAEGIQETAESPDMKDIPTRTPVVTGAWVDTTLGVTTTNVQTQEPSILTDNAQTAPDQQRGNDTIRSAKPKLPASALERVLLQARDPLLRSEDSLGEATIHSLEELIEHSEGADGSFLNFEDDTLEQLQLPTEKPKTAAERQRMEELQRIKKMNEKINKLQGDMHSMHRGVNKISQIAQPSKLAAATAPEQAAKAVDAAAPVQGSRCAACEVCKDPLTMFTRGLRQLLWVYRADATRLGGFRLGPGFWVLFLFVGLPMWIFSELAACLVFCRPVFADSMEGFGLYPDAPELPFVIESLALRPFKPIWEPVMEVLADFLPWLGQFIVHCIWGGVGGKNSGTGAGGGARSADFGMGQDAYV